MGPCVNGVRGGLCPPSSIKDHESEITIYSLLAWGGLPGWLRLSHKPFHHPPSRFTPSLHGAGFLAGCACPINLSSIRYYLPRMVGRTLCPHILCPHRSDRRSSRFTSSLHGIGFLAVFQVPIFISIFVFLKCTPYFVYIVNGEKLDRKSRPFG